ncbi:MAG: GAF domain-containing protein [Actinomycetota bacterium]|nr:GAF domain-containing protein [Actinomycetota bacterium]
MTALAGGKRSAGARGRRQAAIASLAREALATADGQALFDYAVGVVARTIGVEYSHVLELLPDADSLLLRAGVGWRKGLVGTASVPAGTGSEAGYALASEAPVIVQDFRTENRFGSPALFHDHGLVSGVSVVIPGGDAVFGVLGAHTGGTRVFTSDDIEFLQAAAAVLGAAVAREERDGEQRRLLASERAARAQAERLLEAEREARSEAQAAQKRLGFLAKVTELLAESLDYEATLGRIVRLAIPTLADWCIVDELLESGEIARVAVAAHASRKEKVLEALRADYPATWDSPQPAARALRAGEPVLFEEFSADSLRETVRDERHFQLLSELDPRAAIALPLVARGQTVGAITFGSSDADRRYRPVDVALGEEVARRAALAIDRARLYRGEQSARLEAEEAQERLEFLAESSAVLSSSLDYEATLRRVAQLAVSRLADWCVVYIDEGGTVRQLEVAHADPDKEELVRETNRRYPFDPTRPSPVMDMLETGEPLLLPEIPDSLLASAAHDEEHLRLLRNVGFVSAMMVPLVAQARTFGGIVLISSQRARRYGPSDLSLAQELARRAALAVANARLFREAEERANAALALSRVGDGVFLLDAEGVVRLWNPAAEAITGIPGEDVVDRSIEQAVPGWSAIADRVPVSTSPGKGSARAETLPLDVGEREIWLSVSGVRFAEGTVYTFRDLTEERRLDELKTEFVATASHELRTPLAAVYGAAMTLRRRDLALDEDRRDLLLSVIAQEADRLARTVNDILWASRLEAGRLEMDVEPFDPVECAQAVLDAARTHVPVGIELVLAAAADLPPVVADSDKVRQVLANLVDNAVKYSPDGGRVAVRIERSDGAVRFAVDDRGLGIPAREQARIFDKFYRLDPNLTRGVGGTGLGLYICRELVRHMRGRIWVASEEGKGSTFFVEFPFAETRVSARGDAVEAS